MATPHDLAYVAQHPLLNPGDRRGIVQLLGGPRATPRSQLTSIQNIDIQRALPNGPRRIYRVYGSGGVEAPAEVAFEALSNLQLIPAWDVLFKGARYLDWTRHEAGGGAVEVGRIHLVYGLPGVSRLIHDRDFILRAVRVFFPSGVCVLCCRSLSADEGREGDPAPGRNMIRGWMWSSGYVVVPSDRDSCVVNISLQVDPKGWVPAAIVNMSLEAIPLNIARLRTALARLPPDLAAHLGALNLQQACAAKPLAPPVGSAAAAHGGSGAGAGSGEAGARGRGIGMGSAGTSASSVVEMEGAWHAAREAWGAEEEAGAGAAAAAAAAGADGEGEGDDDAAWARRGELSKRARIAA